MPPLLDYDPRWRDANHNTGPHGAECQRPCKNQSDHSSKNHDTISFSHFLTAQLQTNPAAGALPGPSPSKEGVIENQEDH